MGESQSGVRTYELPARTIERMIRVGREAVKADVSAIAAELDLALGRAIAAMKSDWRCRPSRQGLCKSNQGDKDTKWHKVRKIAAH
jgi:hypothetical protein